MLQNTMNNKGVVEHLISASDNYRSKTTVVLTAILAALAVMMFANVTYAANVDAGIGGGDIDQLDDIWDFFKNLVSGIGGKILALLALVAAFWQVFEQNWRAAGGAGMVAIALAFGPGIIEGLFDASVQLLPLL